MECVVFLMNKWCEIEKYCKCLSCITPCYLGRRQTTLDAPETYKSSYIDVEKQLRLPCLEVRVSLIKLLIVLEQEITNLVMDFTNFIVPCLEITDIGKMDSFLAICAKYQFYKTLSVISRLTHALSQVLLNEDLMSTKVSLTYFTQTLLPKNKLYHGAQNEPLVVTDKLNAIYKIAFCEYLKSLHHPHKILKVKIPINSPGGGAFLGNDKYQEYICLEKITIVAQNTELNNLLKWSAEISSFPVIPPNIMGNLVSTTDKRMGKCALLQPGYDSSLHSKTIMSPTVCINCKLLNLCIGHTDDVEQREKLKCCCICKESTSFAGDGVIYQEEESFLEKLTNINGQMCLHLLFLSNEDDAYKGYGCQCEDHKVLFHRHVKKYYDLISDLQLLPKTRT